MLFSVPVWSNLYHDFHKLSKQMLGLFLKFRAQPAHFCHDTPPYPFIPSLPDVNVADGAANGVSDVDAWDKSSYI